MTTMRMRPTEYPHITWNEDKGLPCISGTRLTVQDVVDLHLDGQRIEEIQENFPSYTLTEIASAIAYYFDHRDEVDRIVAERQRMAEAALAEIERRQGPSPLREKLRKQKQGA